MFIDRSLPYDYKLQSFFNSTTYMGVHHLKRGTAACARPRPINSAKIRISSSLQQELVKEWIWWCQLHWTTSSSASLSAQAPQWRINQTKTIDWPYLGTSILALINSTSHHQNNVSKNIPIVKTWCIGIRSTDALRNRMANRPCWCNCRSTSDHSSKSHWASACFEVDGPIWSQIQHFLLT